MSTYLLTIKDKAPFSLDDGIYASHSSPLPSTPPLLAHLLARNIVCTTTVKDLSENGREKNNRTDEALYIPSCVEKLALCFHIIFDETKIRGANLTSFLINSDNSEV